MEGAAEQAGQDVSGFWNPHVLLPIATLNFCCQPGGFTVCMCLQPPDFYDRSPPAPPGLIWWQYKADVPPLPPPTDVNPAFVRYGWRYDPSWHPLSYIPNSMDLVSHHPHALPALSELKILLSVAFCWW